MLAHFAKQDSN